MKYLLLIGSILVLVVLALLCTNTFFQQDDFDFLNIRPYQSENLIQAVFQFSKKMYFGIDGRSVSLIYLQRTLILPLFSAEVNSFLTSVVLLGGAYLIVRIFYRLTEEGFENSVSYFFVSAIFIVMCLWMGMRPILARILYWPTSQFYTYINFFFLLWIVLFFSKRRPGWFFLVLSFNLTLSGVNIAAGVLTFFVLSHLLLPEFLRFSRKWSFLIFILLIAGAIIAVIAPGNFNRAAGLEHGIDFNIVYMLRSFVVITKEYLLMSKWIFIGGILTALYFIAGSLYTSINYKLLTKAFFLFFLTAFSTIVPFLPLPGAASKHTAIHFQFLMFIAIVLGGFILFKRIALSTYVRPVVFILLSSLFLWTGLRQYQLGLPVKKEITKREQIMESHRGTNDTLYFKKIIVPETLFTNRFWDYTNEEPYVWALNCMQQYYQTGPIIMLEPEKK